MNEILGFSLILLLGFVVQKVLKKLGLPAVTAYLILGIAIGPYALNLIGPKLLGASGLVSEIALGVIAFSIGGNFSRINLKRIGKSVLVISIFEVFFAFLFVLIVSFFLFHKHLYLCLLLGSVAAATAPAATVMIIREYRAKGILTNTLLGIVAIDDAWGLILFAICFAIAKSLVYPENISLLQTTGIAFLKIVIALLLGGILGWFLSFLSKLAKTRDELLIYTLGFIFLGIGLSKSFDLSVLLVNMSMGVAAINFSRVGKRFFDTIEMVDNPLFLLFFVISGANLEIPALRTVGLISIGYLIARIIGKFGGCFIGSYVVHASKKIKKYLGFGLVPQAGVALGMALYIKTYLPEAGNIILPVIIGSTVIYEIFGPLCTKFALVKAGEIAR